MMKKANFIPVVVALAMVAGTVPVSAISIDIGSNTRAGIETRRDINDDDYKEDDKRGDSDDKGRNDHWKSWMFHSGVTGTVTAKSDDRITVKARSGTTYSVNTEDAKIRYTSSGNTSIDVGDTVFVQGVINGTSILATVIIDADNKSEPTPNDEDRREGIVGTVTAKGSTSLTVLGKNGTTYTVAAADARVWKNKTESSSFSAISVGDSVVIQGSMSGPSVTAAKIYAVSLPKENNDGDIRGTVTAKSGTTITILASDGTSYTVDAEDSEVHDRRNKDSDLDEIEVGEMIVVDGEVSGSSIEADVITEAKMNTGFFVRIGAFFKHLFNKNN